MGGGLAWGHRTSSSRDDYTGITPPLRRVESRGSLKDDAYERLDRDRTIEREQLRERDRERERDRDVQVQQERERRDQRERERQDSAEAGGSGQRGDNVKHEGEDGMPSTSDFVKKLYKCVSLAFSLPPPAI